MEVKVKSGVDLKDLIKAGVHFGHQRMRWNPKMRYIWGHRNDIHLIDVGQTAIHLERAAQFLKSIASQGKTILWVGTKKPAQEAIFASATHVDMPYVTHRWVGGTLSNFDQVKKSITKMLHYQDVIARADKFPHYTKKEFNMFKKVVDRAEKNIGGIVGLKWPIGAIVLIDVAKERSALKEAIRMNIPVVALVDTNNDPSGIEYVIPGNDDAPRSIKVILDYLSAAVFEGVALKEQIKKDRVNQEKEQLKQGLAEKRSTAAKKSQENNSPVSVVPAEAVNFDIKEMAKKAGIDLGGYEDEEDV